MKDFRKLEVWQKAHTLAVATYEATSSFPKAETYSLTAQIRRSSVSIASNIAEGCGRNGDVEFSRFLQIAVGSASELDYQLLLAHDVRILKEDDFRKLSSQVNDTKMMLIGLLKKLRQ